MDEISYSINRGYSYEKFMKITVSVIKADVGGIGGHTRPSDRLT